MRRVLHLAVVAAILLGSVGFAVLVIQWADAHPTEFRLVFGLSLIALGVGLMVLHLTASDAFLRRHFGEPGAGRMRRSFRSGWAGVVLGAAMLGLYYLDRQAKSITAEAQFQVAFDRGRSAAQARDWQAAADAYSEAIRLEPASVDALRRRGSAYLHLGDFDRALADLDAAARLDPADAGTVYNRGLARARLGDDAGALADFSEAIRLDPTLARAYQARGAVHALRGDAAEAEADWRWAAELDPALNKGGGLDL